MHSRSRITPRHVALVKHRPYAAAMATESQSYRKRADEQRREAEGSQLANARDRAPHAAERWDALADQLERVHAAAATREGEKAARDAKR